jgi:hypothetical protein
MPFNPSASVFDWQSFIDAIKAEIAQYGPLVLGWVEGELTVLLQSVGGQVNWIELGTVIAETLLTSGGNIAAVVLAIWNDRANIFTTAESLRFAEGFLSSEKRRLGIA